MICLILCISVSFTAILFKFIGIFAALLKLPERTTLGPNAKVVKLPADGQSSSPYMGKEPVIVIGAGDHRLEDTELFVPLLRHAFSLTISSEECAKRLKRTSFDQSTVLCMNVINGQSNYYGDSGLLIERQATHILLEPPDKRNTSTNTLLFHFRRTNYSGGRWRINRGRRFYRSGLHSIGSPEASSTPNRRPR